MVAHKFRPSREPLRSLKEAVELCPVGPACIRGGTRRVLKGAMLPSNARPLARLVLLSLMLTFVLARLVSILMTMHRMPNIYFHVRDTHVHHLNYGIFLLAGVGAYLLFSSDPAGAAAPGVFGIGL